MLFSISGTFWGRRRHLSQGSSHIVSLFFVAAYCTALIIAWRGFSFLDPDLFLSQLKDKNEWNS